MDCAKSIDELYDDVKDCDLVITNDAALATALNGRVGKPIIGMFAVTPKMIAGLLAKEVIGKPVERDLRVITSVAEETGLDFRYVHGEIQNIEEIRSHTLEVRKYLYKSAKDVYDSYVFQPTLINIMDRFDIDNTDFYDNFSNIAVIGVELFNDLDKRFLPEYGTYKEVDIYKQCDYTIDTVYQIGNDRQIAENAVDLIDPANAKDFAIVLNSAGPMADAVRSALYRKGISFVNSLNVKDLTQIRDYLQFLSLSLSYSTLRVKHVRELFQSYNATLNANRDEFLLSKQLDGLRADTNAYKLIILMRDIRETTFDEVIESLGHSGVSQVRMLIDDMDMTGKLVNESRVGKLVYAVNNVTDLHHNEQIPENERTGVLITDCKNSVYIDRPVVLYLGMEQDWNIPVVGKPYLDAEDETELNAARLTVLLQQGSRRVYMANTTKNGRTARPTLIFDTIIGGPASDFGKICRRTVQGRWAGKTEPVSRERGSDTIGEARFDSPFSKSSFNAYVSCPRKYMFENLIPSPDQKYTEFGNLIHAFAELYACYPELVRKDGVDRFVGMISDKYAGLSSPLMERLDTEKVRVAMVNVMRFIDGLGLQGIPLDMSMSLKNYPNRFFTELGLDATSSCCETQEDPARIPVHGHFDLYWNGTVVDYKTGRASDGKDIVKAMDLLGNPKYPEFQPMLYLAMAAERAGSKGEFKLFYAMDNDVDSLRDDFDIRRNVRTVRISPGSVVDVIAHTKELREEMAVKFVKDIREESDTVIDTFAGMAAGEPADWSKDTGMISAIEDALGLKHNKTNERNVVSALKRLAGCVYAGMVFTDTTVNIPSDTLTRFMENVNEMHRAALEQARTMLPAEPIGKCRDCQYFYACTRDRAAVDIEEAEE